MTASTIVGFALNDALKALMDNKHHKGVITAIPVEQIAHPKESDYSPDMLCLDIPDTAIVRLNGKDAVDELTQLLVDAPLANISLQLTLDRFFNYAYEDDTARAVIEKTMPDHTMPAHTDNANPEDGSLSHPMLENLTDYNLATIYCTLIRHCGDHPVFLQRLSPRHAMPHCPKIVEGDVCVILMNDTGYILSQDLLKSAFRTGHAKHDDGQGRIEQGREAAQAMAFENDQEIVTAWLKADAFQARLCADLHAVLTFYEGSTYPQWAKGDMFRLLEREAMKQVFAQSLLKRQDWQKDKKLVKAILPAIRQSAKNDVTPSLQKAANELMSDEGHYSGSLQAFVNEAEVRQAVPL